MKSTQRITLDLHEMISPVQVDVKQGETGRVLEITLAEDGKPVVIPQGTVISIGDGTNAQSVVDAFEADGNVITYTINSGFTANVGTKQLELRITQSVDGSTELLYSATFLLNVYARVNNDSQTEIQSTELSALEEVLSSLSALLQSGEVITGIEFNSSNQLVITTTDAGGTTHTYPSGSLKGADGTNGTDGADGSDGVGISSISKTGTSGLVDTYTITLSNGNTATFTVTNGADGSDGEDGSDGQDGADAEGYVIDWYSSPTTEQENANQAVFATIRSLDVEDYRLYLRNGTMLIPAAYIGKSSGTIDAIFIDWYGGSAQTSVTKYVIRSTSSSYQQTSRQLGINATVPTKVSDLTNDSGFIAATDDATTFYLTSTTSNNVTTVTLEDKSFSDCYAVFSKAKKAYFFLTLASVSGVVYDVLPLEVGEVNALSETIELYAVKNGTVYYVTLAEDENDTDNMTGTLYTASTGGTTYTAGTGISISNGVISVSYADGDSVEYGGNA